jgi:hypothetical protein
MIPPISTKDIADPRTLRNPTKNQAAVPFVLRLNRSIGLYIFKTILTMKTP